MSSAIEDLANTFAHVFHLKPVPQSKVLRRQPDGSIHVIYQRQFPANKALSTTSIKSLAGGIYGPDGTVEDFDYKVNLLRCALNRKAYHLSVFLAINAGEAVDSYTLSFSTDTNCLSIEPLER